MKKKKTKKKAKKFSLEKHLRGSIVNALRKLTFMWGPIEDAELRAKVDASLHRCENPECRVLVYSGTSDKKYQEYRLKYPKNKIIKESIRRDHIDPVVPLRHWDWDWNEYITRLFVEDPTQIQILCKPCHDQKTAQENVIRKKLALKSRKKLDK
jgi:5-methylcytosine-specific restriction endonuclease McrA